MTDGRENVRGKVLLVTGATSGLGKAIAEKFASEGAVVTTTSRSKERLERLKSDFNAKALDIGTYVCDVGNEEMVKNAVSSILKEFGRIDYLINNAGVGHYGPIEDISTHDYDEMMSTNVRGIYLMIKYVIPHMKEKKDGYIINISSGAGLNGSPELSIYCATKFAVRGITESVALEAKPYDVTVSAIFPGSINTEFHEKAGSYHSEQTLKSMMQPEDVAETILHMVTRPKRYWIFEATMRAFLLGRA